MYVFAQVCLHTCVKVCSFLFGVDIVSNAMRLVSLIRDHAVDIALVGIAAR